MNSTSGDDVDCASLILPERICMRTLTEAYIAYTHSLERVCVRQGRAAVSTAASTAAAAPHHAARRRPCTCCAAREPATCKWERGYVRVPNEVLDARGSTVFIPLMHLICGRTQSGALQISIAVLRQLYSL
jgi:hypothetical protein